MQAVLSKIDSAIASRLPGLQPFQLSEYKAARNWLRRYRYGQNADNLERVSGYLEAFFHLCNVADWECAHQVVMVSVAETGAEELHRQLFAWGYYKEQQSLYEILLGKVAPDVNLICLSGLGSLHDIAEEYAQAILLHRQALALAKELGSVAAQGTALGSLGNAYLSLGEYGRAISHYQQHLQLARASKEQASIGVALGNLGNVYRIREAYDLADQCLQERLEIARSIQDLKGEADGLCNLGSLYCVQQKLLAAEAVLQQAVKIAQQQGYRLVACRSFGNLGLVYVAGDQSVRAVGCFEQALQLAKDIEDREGQRLAISQLGALCQKLGDYERAFRYQREALSFVTDEVEVAALLLNLGTSCREMEQWDEAVSFYQELITTAFLMAESVPEKRLLQMMGFYCLGLIYREKGELRVAFRYCRRALDFSHESVAPLIDRCLDLQKELGMALFSEMGDG